jgi:hypothetical protein
MYFVFSIPKKFFDGALLSGIPALDMEVIRSFIAPYVLIGRASLARQYSLACYGDLLSFWLEFFSGQAHLQFPACFSFLYAFL